MALFRMAFFRLFALVFRHFAWRISFFRLFAWRYFVFSLFRLAFFRYFVFSLGVISSWRRAITPGEKTKERNNEMAQTSHHNSLITDTLAMDIAIVIFKFINILMLIGIIEPRYDISNNTRRLTRAFASPLNIL